MIWLLDSLRPLFDFVLPAILFGGFCLAVYWIGEAIYSKIRRIKRRRQRRKYADEVRQMPDPRDPP